jgi:hypothetical protein
VIPPPVFVKVTTVAVPVAKISHWKDCPTYGCPSSVSRFVPLSTFNVNAPAVLTVKNPPTSWAAVMVCGLDDDVLAATNLLDTFPVEELLILKHSLLLPNTMDPVTLFVNPFPKRDNADADAVLLDPIMSMLVHVLVPKVTTFP